MAKKTEGSKTTQSKNTKKKTSKTTNKSTNKSTSKTTRAKRQSKPKKVEIPVENTETILEGSENNTEEVINLVENTSEKTATFEEVDSTITVEEPVVIDETPVTTEETPIVENEITEELSSIEVPELENKDTESSKTSTDSDVSTKVQKKILKGTNSFLNLFRLTDNGVSLYSVLATFTIISLVALSIYALYSVVYEIPIEASTEGVSFEPISNAPTYYVDTANEDISTESIVWDSEFKETLDNSLASLTHMNLKQTTSSVNKKGNLANVALTTELETDFANNRLYCKTEYADDIGTKQNEYFYDLAGNLYLTKQADDLEHWLKSQQVAVNVNFDIAEYNNCSEFYDYLLNDFKILNNTTGTVIEDYIYFEYGRASVSRDLTNINFDTLGDTNIQLIFKRVSDTEIYPVSLIKSVGFTKNDNTYTSKITIQIDGLNTDTLEIPEYRTYIEEPYESDDTEIIEEDEG